MSDAMRLKTMFREQRWLFMLLCGLIFLTALTTGQNVFDNAWLIFGYEALFVVAFLASRGAAFYSGPLFPVRSVGFWILSAWFVSITLSLVNSPYGLMMEWFAVQRYFQSLFHILFFLCVRSFFMSYGGNKGALFGWLGASVAALAIAFIIAWQLLPEPLDYKSKEWFLHPPLNAHIRITGFLVATASVALVPFFKDKFRSKTIACILYLLGLSVWGLMFWAGGRGSIVSSVAVCLFLVGLLKMKRQPINRMLIAMAVLVVGGIVLAELFKVFSWNGIFQAADRTIAAGSDPYKLTTGRPKLFGWVIASLNKENAWLLGLGSQGYCFMPNRTFAFQPHNLVFQFLAEWGIVGTVIFLAVLIYGFFDGARRYLFFKSTPLTISVLAALGIILSLGIHSLVDGIFYHAQSSIYMAVAFAVWTARQNETSG